MIVDTNSSDKTGPNTTMTGRQRVLQTLNYQRPDRVPVDLGGTHCSGAHVSVIAKLRQALGLDKPGDPVKVVDPYQMLGEVAADLCEALGLDVILLPGAKNFFGFAFIQHFCHCL